MDTSQKNPMTEPLQLDLLTDPIHGDKFVDICDYAIRENDSVADPREFEKGNRLIFCKTDRLQHLFKVLAGNQNKYVLVSHNSDFNVNEELWDLKPRCIVKWFAQNVLHLHPDLIPIPIGLERPHLHGPGGSGDVSILASTWKASADWTERRHLAYLAASDGTNPKERGPLRVHALLQDWIRIEVTRVPFTAYVWKLRDAKFTLCPPGNGHDCHRTWEALYMGSIPVTKYSACMGMFANLYPIVLVESWEDVTEEFLQKEYSKLAHWGLFPSQHLRPLQFSFWAQRIRQAVRDLL